MTDKIFIDSDVIISSIISPTGAAHLILHTPNLKLHISNYSQKELELVVKRLKLNPQELIKLIQTLSITNLKPTLPELKNQYHRYVADPNDAHILAGVVSSQARFLITYNLKHYKTESIKRNFNIIILTPALFLQYLRSQN